MATRPITRGPKPASVFLISAQLLMHSTHHIVEFIEVFACIRTFLKFIDIDHARKTLVEWFEASALCLPFTRVIEELQLKVWSSPSLIPLCHRQNFRKFVPFNRGFREILLPKKTGQEVLLNGPQKSRG